MMKIDRILSNVMFLLRMETVRTEHPANYDENGNDENNTSIHFAKHDEQIVKVLRTEHPFILRMENDENRPDPLEVPLAS